MKYRKTELGKLAFKERTTELNPRQRSALILIDGNKDDTEIFKAMAAFGLTADDINHLVEMRFIEAADNAQAAPPSAAAKSAEPARNEEPASDPRAALSDQERYQRAYPIATKVTSGLGLRGFRLNLAVESANTLQKLIELAPKIREAVGDEKYAELARALKAY
jgi:hypothetical protein